MASAEPEWVVERERGTGLGLRVMQALARTAPPAVSDPVLWLVSLYFTLVPSRSSAEGTEAYFRALLGRAPTFAERQRQVLTFAKVVLDRVRLLSGPAEEFEIRAEGEGLIVARHAVGQGAVLLGAHFGSFEALRAFDRGLPGLSVRYMMFEENAEATSRLLNRLNPEVSRRIIPVGDGIGAMMAAQAALEAGEFVAFLGDRMPRRTARGEITVDFLGGRVALPRAPYMTALLARVPIILCFAPRTGRRRYAIHFTEIHDGSPVPRAGRDAACAALAQRYADALASMCRRYPYNWFNFFDIWR